MITKPVEMLVTLDILRRAQRHSLNLYCNGVQNINYYLFIVNEFVLVYSSVNLQVLSVKTGSVVSTVISLQ